MCFSWTYNSWRRRSRNTWCVIFQALPPGLGFSIKSITSFQLFCRIALRFKQEIALRATYILRRFSQLTRRKKYQWLDLCSITSSGIMQDTCWSKFFLESRLKTGISKMVEKCSPKYIRSYTGIKIKSKTNKKGGGEGWKQHIPAYLICRNSCGSESLHSIVINESNFPERVHCLLYLVISSCYVSSIKKS